MKNNSNKECVSALRELVTTENVQIGDRLKSLRNLLAKKPDEIASVLTMSANTLKSAESGNGNSS